MLLILLSENFEMPGFELSRFHFVVHIKASMASDTSRFFCVTGSSCVTKRHVSTLFQKTSSLTHYAMEQSVKKETKRQIII